MEDYDQIYEFLSTAGDYPMDFTKNDKCVLM